MNTIRRLKIRMVWVDSLAFEFIFIEFFDLIISWDLNIRNFKKLGFKTSFSVHNNPLNLCVQVENSK